MIRPRPSWINSVNSVTIVRSTALKSCGLRRNASDHTEVSMRVFTRASRGARACNRRPDHTQSFQIGTESLAASGVGCIHRVPQSRYPFWCGDGPISAPLQSGDHRWQGSLALFTPLKILHTPLCEIKYIRMCGGNKSWAEPHSITLSSGHEIRQQLHQRAHAVARGPLGAVRLLVVRPAGAGDVKMNPGSIAG